ncbi:MAG: rhodanese-like domain-containing protein [Saprospiraceae bacterium]
MHLTQFMLTTLLFSFGVLSAFGQKAASYQDLTITDFKQKMNQENVVVLDVRTPQETAAGKIKNAIEIDYTSSDFTNKIKQLDKRKTYLVYCQAGLRSSKACNIMVNNGFDKVYNLTGGFSAWKRAKN